MPQKTTKIITILPNSINSSSSHKCIKNVKAKQLQTLQLIFYGKLLSVVLLASKVNVLQFALSKVMRVPALEKFLSERLHIGRLTHVPFTM